MEDLSSQTTSNKSDSPRSDPSRSIGSLKGSGKAAENAVGVWRDMPGQSTQDSAPERSERTRDPTVDRPSGIPQGQHTSGDRVWTGLAKRLTAEDLRKINMPIFGCDLYHIEPEDMLSKAILSFRDGARKALQGNANVQDLIGSKRPDLELFLRPRREGDPYTTWTWAYELAKAYPLPWTV